jgi:hypothetical protein
MKLSAILVAAATATLAVGACGGDKAQSPPPASPRQTTPTTLTQDHDGAVTPPGAPTPDERSRMVLELDQSQQAVENAAGDCAVACRALASMERAAARLCSLAERDEDKKTCDGAKQKLEASRETVKRTCTSCPGGPVL